MDKYKSEQYSMRYEIENWLCSFTGLRASHMAHRIAQTKTNIQKYGKKIIHHNFNLVPVQTLEINDSYNIANKPNKRRKLIELIKMNGNERLTVKEINQILEA
jgi:hypothetical protein